MVALHTGKQGYPGHSIRREAARDTVVLLCGRIPSQGCGVGLVVVAIVAVAIVAVVTGVVVIGVGIISVVGIGTISSRPWELRSRDHHLCLSDS